MSKTNNYLWNETERHMGLVEQAACEALLQSKFTDVNTKDNVSKLFNMCKYIFHFYPPFTVSIIQ